MSVAGTLRGYHGGMGKDAASPPFVWASLQRREQVATIVSVVLTLGALLAMPHLLVLVAGRTPAGSGSDFVRDAFVLELIAIPLLVVWPLKERFKAWLHDPSAAATSTTASRAQRRWAAAAWIAGLLGVVALVLPQVFFALTNRGARFGFPGTLVDAGALLVAMAPQVLATAPWMWASRRVSARVQSTATGEPAEDQSVDQR